ncbi:hypothetical protein NN561_008164 [Cricetulus griseus]
MAQGSRPPDKERVRSRLPCPVLLRIFKCLRSCSRRSGRGREPGDLRSPRDREMRFARGVLEGKSPRLHGS